MKYDLKLVYDYINGNEINYNIEKLEDNFYFMQLVLKYSKDKNMYNLCSENLKNNYDFVKFLINLFKDDINYIIRVSEKFLQQDNIPACRKLELDIIIRSLLKGDNIDKYFKYLVNARMAYENDLYEIELLKEYSKKDIELLNYIEKGFSIILDKYENSEIILNYYAIQFVLDLIYEEDIDLEFILHNKFNSLTEIDNYGIYNFLLETISKYDNTLSEYIANHIEILSVLNDKINFIKSRWDLFKEENELLKWNILVDEFEKYIIDNKLEKEFSWESLICYFVKKYNFYESFLNSDILDSVKCDFLCEYYTLYENTLNLMKLKHLYTLEKFFKRILNKKVVKLDEEFIEKEGNKTNKGKCKIIKFEDYNCLLGR